MCETSLKFNADLYTAFHKRKKLSSCNQCGRKRKTSEHGVNLWLQLTVIFNMRSYLKYKDIIIVPLGSRSLSSSDHSGFTKK